MATYTPNYNLEKPDASDPFGNFRTLFNDNMDKIDNISGGGGGGHVIVDENGNNMPSRLKLEFMGNVEVTDDSINNKTVVDVKGGGGGGSSENYSTVEQVVGTWINGKPLYQITFDFTTSPSSGWLAIPTDTTGWNIDFFTVKNVSIILPQYNYHYGMTGLQFFCAKDINTGQIKYTCDDGALRGRQIYLTVQYTKTTD